MRRSPFMWFMLLIFLIAMLGYVQTLVQLSDEPAFLIADIQGWSWGFIVAQLIVAALYGYAAWRYYEMTPNAVFAGLIAFIAAALYEIVTLAVSLSDIDLVRQVYILDRIQRGMTVDYDLVEQLISPNGLIAAQGVSLALKVAGVVLVLISRKHLVAPTAVPEAPVNPKPE